MAKHTDNAEYNAGETFENVPSPLSDAGNHDNYSADDFGLGAFYIVSLNTRPSCDNEVNPLLADDVGLGAFYMVSLKTRPSCYNEVNPLQTTSD
ncbi:unnamed protein product [Protopolystoma xenopodis]|uniref:Uncharacterized protein n=1 Tax=Protopolystoma xenopodis TaxID=117903 RepID=A0A448X8Z5_9PLAT|nr:unnamed protein product [Protopolystoma xenopodis]